MNKPIRNFNCMSTCHDNNKQSRYVQVMWDDEFFIFRNHWQSGCAPDYFEIVNMLIIIVHTSSE